MATRNGSARWTGDLATGSAKETCAISRALRGVETITVSSATLTSSQNTGA
jgi:hypothetical protein